MTKDIQKFDEMLLAESSPTRKLEEQLIGFGFQNEVAEFADFLIEPEMLPKRPAFYSGVKDRLLFLDEIDEDADTRKVTDILLKRYRDNLGISCPRAVKNWMKGQPVGTDLMENHYDLCLALSMNLSETEAFFRKYYLLEPFHVKSTLDAVYYYGFVSNLTYGEIQNLLKIASDFHGPHSGHTATEEVMREIAKQNNEEAFLSYLKQHTYLDYELHTKAREIIKRLMNSILPTLEEQTCARLYEAITGFSYQDTRVLQGHKRNKELPKEVTYCFPTDRTFLDLFREGTDAKKISRETLRKSLIILEFYDFYKDATADPDPELSRELFYDFRVETDQLLLESGLGKLYIRHPFDALILYCATYVNPIEAWQAFNVQRFL